MVFIQAISATILYNEDIMRKEQLALLKNVFPKLWVEHPESFHTFFKKDLTMNASGRSANTALKQLHRMRTTKPCCAKLPPDEGFDDHRSRKKT